MNQLARRVVLTASLAALATSTVVAAPVATAHADALPVMHVLDAGGLRVVVDAAPEPAWGRGAPQLVSSGHPAIARRAVDPHALPARIASRAGERVRLFDARGVRCEATLGDFALVGRAEVHFGMRAAWEGEEASSGRATPMTPTEIAADVWDLGDSLGLTLTASVHPVSGDCTGARWAMPASAGAPSVAAVEPAQGAQRAVALARFRTLPAWRAAQRTYLASEVDGRHARRWDEHAGAQPEVLVVRAPGAAPRVWVASHVTTGGCGGFEGDLSALFDARVGAAGAASTVTLTPAWTSTSARVSTPRAALGGADGATELLFDEARLAPANEGGYEFDALEVPYLDCPC